MSCTTLIGITKGCDNNIGGITAIYINDMDNITSTTEDTATWMIDAQAVSTPYEVFEFRRNTGNFTEEAAIDLVNQSSFYTQTITLMFARREASKSKAIKILGEGQRDLAVIIKDANGKYWYFPTAQLTAVAEGSGTAKADGSKYSVTFVAENEFLAKEVDPTIIAGLIS
jgi:NACalpha-BTF3-like transcription factor